MIKPYIQIARPDHWIKNIFLLPGIVIAYFFQPALWNLADVYVLALGVLATCLTASSNYVINEVLDAEKDRHHPIKKYRPIPSGKVNLGVAYVEWIALGLLGMGLGFVVATPMGWSCVLLWVMGTIYNIPPIRTKDLPYADVLSESINNPIRMAMGWYMTGAGGLPPMSILLAYWMFGAYLMAIKRLAEYRTIGDARRAAAYRKSFAFYTEERLIVSILFYGALFTTFATVFISLYRLEMVLATPLVALAMAYYLHMGFKPESPAQYPEQLYKQHKLLAIVIAAFAVCVVLLFLDVPQLHQKLVLR
jgi:decaprenyl-phosphate phosphoribosyltransferase